jgi:hypothetical protein
MRTSLAHPNLSDTQRMERRQKIDNLPVFYNPVTRRIDPLVCETCKKTTRRIFLQDGKTNFVLLCPECGRT